MEGPDQVVVEPADRSQILHQCHDLELGRPRIVGDDRQVGDQVIVGDLQQQVVVLLPAHNLEEGGPIARGEAHCLGSQPTGDRDAGGLQPKDLSDDHADPEQRLDPQWSMSEGAGGELAQRHVAASGLHVDDVDGR
jgi:hypothetical protein